MAVVENKEEIIREHRAHEDDTGSPEVQVAVRTCASTSTTITRAAVCSRG